MKNRILSLILMLAVVFVRTFALAPEVAPATVVNAESVNEEASGYSADKALKARFENMLNRNFSYDDDIADIDALVNNSVLALLDKRDKADESFIAESIVTQYVYDMYGIEIVDLSQLNPQFPQKQGFVYIIPRGYSVYSHDVTDICENEDGSFTVTSSVLIDGHDNTESEYVATTLFVKNEASCFGYNIIYSNIAENTIDI